MRDRGPAASGGWRRSAGARRDRARRDRAGARVTRLRIVAALAVGLGLAQVLFEDVVLFLATTRDGLPGALSSPLVAVAVPFTIVTLLMVVLVGGALWSRARPESDARREGTGSVGPDDRRSGDDPDEDPPDRER